VVLNALRALGSGGRSEAAQSPHPKAEWPSPRGLFLPKVEVEDKQ
jgi:hypothetical protein